jgi:hypothetical protein
MDKKERLKLFFEVDKNPSEYDVDYMSRMMTLYDALMFTHPEMTLAKLKKIDFMFYQYYYFSK